MCLNSQLSIEVDWQHAVICCFSFLALSTGSISMHGVVCLDNKCYYFLVSM